MKAAILSILCVTAALLATALCEDYHGDTYQKLSAAEKNKKLWTASIMTPTPAPWYSAIEIMGLFLENMNTSMDSVSDDMPKAIFGKRPKLIHSVGALAQAKFVSNGKHPYTGSFAGTDNLLIRMSLAAEPKEGSNITPGIALKFLRNGVPSANMVAMYNLEGQSSWNVFANNLTNHVPDLTPSSPFILKQLKSTFAKASRYPLRVGLACISEYDQAGSKVTKPVFPYKMIFKPTDALRTMFPSQYTGVSFLDQLETIPIQTLYTVYAMTGPDSTELVEMGKIDMTSQFTATSFGDRNLFFQHCQYEKDLKYRPDWA